MDDNADENDSAKREALFYVSCALGCAGIAVGELGTMVISENFQKMAYARDKLVRAIRCVDEVLMKRSVEDLELMSRARKCLDSLGVKCLGDLIQKTREDLLQQPNFGKKALREIEEALEKLGLKLKGSPADGTV